MAPAAETADRDADRIFVKCAWRLIPFMLVLYIVNFIDRTNVAFAALQMNRDLGFSPSVYGFGAGLFMVGYFLCEAPSNYILARVGARFWIFRIMATWGLVAASCALIEGPLSLYGLRFLLGVAEAGFYPGMLLYLTCWFPQRWRARLASCFIAGAPLAAVIGAPLSGFVLGMDGLFRLHGWQWLFLVEGLPAFGLAFLVLRLLPNGPATARWLTPAEKQTIAARLDAGEQPQDHRFWTALRDPRAIALGFVLFGVGFARLGLGFWLPLIVQNLGFDNRATGVLVAIPYLAAVFAMLALARSSDRAGERILHIAVPLLVAVAALLTATAVHSGLLLFSALCCAVVCLEAMQGPFWCVPTLFLGRNAAAVGIALIAAMGNLGGFIGTTAMGALKQGSGGFSLGLATLAAAVTASSAITLLLGRGMSLAHKPASATAQGH